MMPWKFKENDLRKSEEFPLYLEEVAENGKFLSLKDQLPRGCVPLLCVYQVPVG